MNNALKQRLIGAAVLFIFAGLLWPILFNFDKSTRIEPLQLDIPDAPVLPKVASKNVSTQQPSTNPIAKKQSSVSVKKAPAKSTAIEKKNKTKKAVDSSVADRPQLDANGIPVSFVVQVATFSEWSNADRLRDKLVNENIKAYVKPETSVQAGPYIIAVGPLLTYAAASTVADKLKQEHGIGDSIIRRFRGR